MKNSSNGDLKIGTRVFQRSIVVDIWHGLHSKQGSGWHPVTCDVTLEIDVDSLMRQLARKALGNSAKKTHLASGRIRLKATKIEKPEVHRCKACGRPEDECSVNPCKAVQRDREAVI